MDEMRVFDGFDAWKWVFKLGEFVLKDFDEFGSFRNLVVD